MSAFSTFDYVEDGSGTVFVVRTPLDGVSNYVLYPAYRRVGQGLQRVVHTGEHLDGEPGSDWAVDAGCVVRPAEFLRLVRRWDGRPVVPAQVGNADLARFFAQVYELGGRLFLYGSRLLDMATPRSDWDLLMTVERDPRDVVEQALAELAEARFFTPDELAALFTLPLDACPVAVDELTGVLGRSLTYLYIGGVRVDIMIGSRSWAELIPAFPETSGHAESLDGVIQPGAGESYLMPRAVTLDRGPGRPAATVFYPTWFLQGLERMAGTRVHFTGLRRTGPGRYWFGARHSSLRIDGGRP